VGAPAAVIAASELPEGFEERSELAVTLLCGSADVENISIPAGIEEGKYVLEIVDGANSSCIRFPVFETLDATDPNITRLDQPETATQPEAGNMPGVAAAAGEEEGAGAGLQGDAAELETMAAKAALVSELRTHRSIILSISKKVEDANS
jgi:hypothetical protein